VKLNLPESGFNIIGKKNDFRIWAIMTAKGIDPSYDLLMNIAKETVFFQSQGVEVM
jgi:hypothetical protein